MADNVKPIKGVGFTEEERKLCVKALMTYQKVDMELYLEPSRLPFLPPSEDERKIIDLLIGDFKGPSWDRTGDVPSGF